MKLTIIPIDGAVGKDEIFYNNLDLISCYIPSDVHALQWYDTNGWIEFKSSLVQNQEITELPSWANYCLAKWNEANTPKPPEPPTAEQNKTTAVNLLSATDWTTIPDVSDPAKSNPYLSNANEFITWRNLIRQSAIYPVAGDINWPTQPQEAWTTV